MAKGLQKIMLAGHLALGLALKARCRKIPLLALLLAVQLLDIIWLVLIGQEVENFRFTLAAGGAKQLDFSDAVYSHSLFWSLFYALVVFLVFVRAEEQHHWAVPLSLGVFSHWLLDALVYSNLPFANFGPHLQFGLNSFSSSPLLLLGIESLLVFAGWGFYYRNYPRGARAQWPPWVSLAVLLLLLLLPQLWRRGAQ